MDVMAVIGAAPLIESVEIYKGVFNDVPSRPSETSFVRSIHPRRLQRLSLMHIGTNPQACIVAHLHLPTSCTLYIRELSSPLGWEAILHPSVASHLGRLSISCFKVHPRYIELSEEPNKERCNVSLAAVRTGRIEIDSLFDLSEFDLTHVRTMDVDIASGSYGRLPWHTIFLSAPTVDSLTLRKGLALKLFPCDSLPQLREIRLVDVYLDSTLPFAAEKTIVGYVLEMLQRRKQTYRPVERLILRKSPCEEASLALLRAEVLKVTIE